MACMSMSLTITAAAAKRSPAKTIKKKVAPKKVAPKPAKMTGSTPTQTIRDGGDPTGGKYAGYVLGLYPEWGTYPGSGADNTWLKLEDPKNIEREIIHGRFAMLAVAGAWGQENLGMGPWFNAGANCTPSECQFLYLNQSIDLEQTGFIIVLAAEILLFGGAEAYRTGLLDNPFPELTVGDVYPGGRFDPFNLGDKEVSGSIDELKMKELKHCRLAMFAWLGLISQAFATNPNGPSDAVGPIANWAAHVADPSAVTIVSVLFNK